jgi:hypothetical protein
MSGPHSAAAYQGHVSAELDTSVVTLEGRVPRMADVPAVCRPAWLVLGVVDVVCHLTVGTPITPDHAATVPPPGPAAHARPAGPVGVSARHQSRVAAPT